MSTFWIVFDAILFVALLVALRVWIAYAPSDREAYKDWSTRRITPGGGRR